MINKAIIKVNSKKDIEIVNEMINETFQQSDIIWKEYLAFLTVYDVDSFQLRLNKLNVAMFDITLKANILIVPFFNELFIKYVDKVNNGVSTLFEVFIKLINEEYVKEDSKKILEKIKKKDLDTLKAFLQSNCNSCEAANELYLHRNSFNYRMNSVSNTLNIDIRDINSMMFLNLIINICA